MLNSLNCCSGKGFISTRSTRASSGPSWHHAVKVSSAARLPVAMIYTEPSGRFPTVPTIPKLLAFCCACLRNQTPCTLPSIRRANVSCILQYVLDGFLFQDAQISVTHFRHHTVKTAFRLVTVFTFFVKMKTYTRNWSDGPIQ